MSNEENIAKAVPKDGPEFAPLRNFVKTFPIVLTIYNKDDIVVREEKLDYGNHEHRQWLGKLSFWAWQNGHTVQTEAE